MGETIHDFINLDGSERIEERQGDGALRNPLGHREVTGPVPEPLGIVSLQMDRRKVITAADARLAKSLQDQVSVRTAVTVGKPHDEHEPAQAAFLDGRRQNNIFDCAQPLQIKGGNSGSPR